MHFKIAVFVVGIVVKPSPVVFIGKNVLSSGTMWIMLGFLYYWKY